MRNVFQRLNSFCISQSFAVTGPSMPFLFLLMRIVHVTMFSYQFFSSVFLLCFAFRHLLLQSPSRLIILLCPVSSFIFSNNLFLNAYFLSHLHIRCSRFPAVLKIDLWPCVLTFFMNHVWVQKNVHNSCKAISRWILLFLPLQIWWPNFNQSLKMPTELLSTELLSTT